MGQYLDLMLAASKRSRGYSEKLLAGIKPEQAARKPHFETNGSTLTVDTNHPTFVFGHLATYPVKMLRISSLDPAAVPVPAGWDDLFKAGTPCQDDPNRTIYPKLDEVTAVFFKNMEKAQELLAKVDDKVLLLPTPDERYREYFPTTGVALNFLLNNHVMMHLGQVSVWRRCFGLPSAM